MAAKEHSGTKLFVAHCLRRGARLVALTLYERGARVLGACHRHFTSPPAHLLPKAQR